jgi:beta-ketoacyl-acyl-carrier-protein synthase II
MRRVVVTGLGVVSPVGNDVDTAWHALLEKRSGVGPITAFDPEPFPVRIQAEVKDFDVSDFVDQRELRYMDRNVQFAVGAVRQALDDAGLEIRDDEAEQAAVIFGSGGGGMEMVIEAQKTLETKGPRRITPFLVANLVPDAASGYIAIMTGARGPNLSISSACATGANTIGEAWETVRRGDADVAITGSTEAVLLPVFHANWCAMRALAADNEHPETACKPFDLRRDGFVTAEGAAALILESLEHALARKAPIYAEMVGYGASNDAYDMIASHESGRGPRRSMVMALKKAGLQPEQVDYINAHGTGTPLNDRVETAAIKEAFGRHAYDLVVSSTKALTGHMMGAAGAMESLVAVKAVKEDCIPPTANLEEPDPDCDLDYAPGAARERRVEVAMSNSIGLGGHNACTMFRKFTP